MKYLLILLVFFSTVILHAQDIIYKKDKTKIDGKVLEVGITDVKYKTALNPEGPVYVIPKSEIAIIIYQNGTTDIFSSPENSSKPKFDSLSVNFCRNFIGVDIAEFTSASLGMLYEHTFGKKGMFAIRLPFSVGILQQSYGFPEGKIFNTGIDFLYFPTGQGTFKYYTAPYFEWGMFRDGFYLVYERLFAPSNNERYNGQHLAGGIKNGILYQPTRHFALSADFGFGIKKDETIRTNESVESHFKANVIIGYRF
jgi:hypothetical protein